MSNQEIIEPAMIEADWNLTFPIIKKEISEDRHIIAGYASVEVIDSQNELIPITTLEKAWEQFKKAKDFYFGSLMHSNVPVIKILDEYTDKDGTMWKSGVDENGLFIVAEVRQDIQKGIQTWELIEKEKLTGFSIGGEALESSKVCEGKCFTRIEEMELHEIAVVDKPANQPSTFKIVKRAIQKEDREMSIDEIKWKIKEIVEKRKELLKNVKPLPWEEKISDEEKSNMLSELDELDKRLNKYRDMLGIRLADQALLSKGEVNKESKELIKFNYDKIDKALSKLEIIRLRAINKPFAGYKDFKDCERQNAGKGDPAAYCATIMRQVEKIDRKTDAERARTHFNITEEDWNSYSDEERQSYIDKLPERGEGLNKQDERPPKAQWEACVSRAEGISSIADPEAFCGDLYYHDRPHFNAFSKGEEIDLEKCGCIEKKDIIIKCPVDDVITKSTWDKLDKGITLIEMNLGSNILKRSKKE